MPWSRDQIAERIAQEVQDGYVVNLGIGIPTLVGNYVPSEKKIKLQSENGLLGIGPFPEESQLDPDLINAGKQTITEVKGASYFSSSDSFAMIRGGHVDLTVLGAMQVDQNGNIANWMIPGKFIKGMGGAMDLVAGARNVIVAMQHTDKNGTPKLVEKCDLPLTGVHCINKVVTDYGVFEVRDGSFVVQQMAPGISEDDIREKTGGNLKFELGN